MGAAPGFVGYAPAGAAVAAGPTGSSSTPSPAPASSLSAVPQSATRGLRQGLIVPAISWRAFVSPSSPRGAISGRNLVYVDDCVFVGTVGLSSTPADDDDGPSSTSDEPIDVDDFEFAMGG